MATKNISRSAVEGGRYPYNKHDRRRSHRQERQYFRYWRDETLKGVAFADERAIKRRPAVGKGFTDKLSPAYRWLASRCGQRWDDVFSELSEKFDTRKLSSWHVVEQHMLREVEGAKKRDWLSGFHHERFFVDEEGFLRDRGQRRSRRAEKRLGPRMQEVADKVGKRRVREVDGVLHWMVEDGVQWVRCECIYGGRYRCWRLPHRRIRSPRLNFKGENYYHDEHQVVAYKQWRKLNENECKWWMSIRKDIRRRFTI